MTTNSPKSNFGRKNSDKSEHIFFIKFGDRYFEIHENRIAYAYYSESVLFIVHDDGQKLPISTYDLENFHAQLDQKQFFQISDSTIVNREAVFHFEEFEYQLLLSLNFKKVITLEIAVDKINDFKKWLQYQS